MAGMVETSEHVSSLACLLKANPDFSVFYFPFRALSTTELVVETTAEMIAIISSLIIFLSRVILFYYPTIGLQPKQLNLQITSYTGTGFKKQHQLLPSHRLLHHNASQVSLMQHHY